MASDKKSESDKLIETEVKKPDLSELRLICGKTVDFVFSIIFLLFSLLALSYLAVFYANLFWEGCHKSSLKVVTLLEFFDIAFPIFYLMILGILTLYLGNRNEKPSRIWLLIMILQSSLIAYLVYSPHVTWFPERAKDCMIYSYTTTQTILVPLFLLNSLFCVFALYKLNSLRIPRWYEGDDSYEVIYGGEESSTKVIEENSNA